ncbi:MAG: sugar phosphate isomerase/epimerase family protein, partial [Solirubrobacterales bacterium]
WGRRDPLAGRLGLSVPREWWASAPLLKSYEAAGFAWVQLHSPPRSVLADARQCIQHAAAVGTALATTGLDAVLHAPGELRAGDPSADAALERLLSYAAEAGASHVVYHALALADEPGSEFELAAETRSLARLAPIAERLGVRIALENLAPLNPGPETISANPISLRGVAQRIGSDAVGLCLDIGHAHVIADQRHTSVERLCEPVLDLVTCFHVHDNLGARRRPSGDQLGTDPLRLDLHLPPGRGTVPWQRVAPMLSAHEAPLVLEVHPPFRSRANDLSRRAARLLGAGRLHPRV